MRERNILTRGSVRIVVALPASESELQRHIDEPTGRDLLRAPNMTVQKYRRQVMHPLQRAIPVWRELGAAVCWPATRNVLAGAAAAGSTEALILLAHWVEGSQPAIELDDGHCPVSEAAAMFAADWTGVADLCVCQSKPLALALNARCHDITVKWIDVPALPALWLGIYTVALTLRRDQQLHYLDALDRAMRSFDHATGK